MIITTVTFTGADDNTDIAEMITLSKRFPMIEWGILLSEKAAGSPRYPSKDWIEGLQKSFQELQEETGYFGAQEMFRLSAHLCGKTMRNFMSSMKDEVENGEWVTNHGLNERHFNHMFRRAQANFNAKREGFTEEFIADVIDAWRESMDGEIVTQHNDNNADAWKATQSRIGGNHTRKDHHILIDASGGNGKSPEAWSKPISGMFTGYAGGLGPENLVTQLDAINAQVGDGFTWIDMEGSLRDADDNFSLSRVEEVMKIIETEGPKRGWI